jgi:perosamine synthetase
MPETSELPVRPQAGDEILRLRAAGPGDALQLFEWRNLPSIIAVATVRRPIRWEDHRLWFRDALAGGKRSIFVILCDGTPAGQVRFEWLAEGESEISVYLIPDFTGRGLGVAAIRAGCHLAWKKSPGLRITAWVRADNVRSIAAFSRAGFEIDRISPQRPDHVRFAMRPPCGVPHVRLTHGAEEEAAVARVIRSGRWAGGAEVAMMENAFAHEAGVGHAVGVGSGLGALRLALLALEVGPGSAVAVPAYSCVALANAVLACGARPIPVDVEPDTWSLSPVALRAAKARCPDLSVAIAVHLFGCPARIAELQECGVRVVEDCSHAFGRMSLGRLGTVAVVSLYATKLLSAGEGGVVLTDDAAIAGRIRGARDYTDRTPASWRLNDKMTDVEAALAVCQLRRLPEMLARRDEIAARYADLLAPFVAAGVCRLPINAPGRIWYRYAIGVREADPVIAAMARRGVTAPRPVENWCPDWPQALPASEAAFRTLVSLPIFPTLTPVEQERVAAAFGETARICKKEKAAA